MTDNMERALQERLLARSQVSARDVEALRLYARTLPTRRSFWQRPALAWAGTAAAVVLAAVVGSRLLFSIPGPGATPSPSNPAPTTPAETPVVTPAPTLGSWTIQLLTGSGSTVSVVLDDPEGLLNGVRTEQAGATMTVRWFDWQASNVDPDTVRLLWVGYPEDETVRLRISSGPSGEVRLDFVQKAPPANSDAEGEDRILVLDFETATGASDLVVTFNR